MANETESPRLPKQPTDTRFYNPHGRAVFLAYPDAGSKVARIVFPPLAEAVVPGTVLARIMNNESAKALLGTLEVR